MLTNKKNLTHALLLMTVLTALAFAQPTIAFADAPVTHPIPQATPEPPTQEIAPSGPPLSLTLSLLFFCAVFGLLIGVFVLGVIVRRPGNKDTETEKAKHEHGL